MNDRQSKEVRSFIMSRVMGKDTKPEVIVRRHLHSRGLRFRYQVIIFVHGCFWHGHRM
ncbi:MAG: hypothetical protein IPN60_11815 [Saprospiraceae bacterium]|nr:hypothetical protein [Candidatus Opimibacter skivensis]